MDSLLNLGIDHLIQLEHTTNYLFGYKMKNPEDYKFLKDTFLVHLRLMQVCIHLVKYDIQFHGKVSMYQWHKLNKRFIHYWVDNSLVHRVKELVKDQDINYQQGKYCKLQHQVLSHQNRTMNMYHLDMQRSMYYRQI